MNDFSLVGRAVRGWRLFLSFSVCMACLAGSAGRVHASPSGGPYGPLHVNYLVPPNAPHVYYVAPDGSDTNAGTDVKAPTTLAAAVAKATTNDAVILRGGVYRVGNIQFNQGITLQPYGEEQPILKGTRVVTGWEQQKNGLWRAPWTSLFPAKYADWWRRFSVGKLTPPYRFNNDMLFIDGELLHAVGWEGELDDNSYVIDYDHKQIYLQRDPTKHVVEATAFDNAMVRVITEVNGRPSDRKGPTIRGITFTQYAYRAFEVEAKEPEGKADEATFGKDVVGTLLENDTFTFCSRVGAYLRGDKLVVRNCWVSDTRTEGLYVLASADVLLEKNIFARNNIENIIGYFPAAVKIFNQCYRATCRDNLVMDQPFSNGIWYDVGNVDARFVDNIVRDCGDGFFFEISKGAICTGNVFINCENGVRSLNSSNVRVYQNTFVNTVASFERTERSAVGDHFGWHPSTGPDVAEREGHVFVNNLVVNDARRSGPMLRTEQALLLKGKLTTPQLKQVDGNVYVRRGGPSDSPLFAWSPVATATTKAEYASIAELQKLSSDYEVNGKYLPEYYGAWFRGQETARFEPLTSVSGYKPVALPAEVLALLGVSQTDISAPGAYQRKN